MSYSSKRILTSMVAGVFTAIAYTIYALGETAPGSSNLAAWAKAMLIFIGIGVGAGILIQILFHIGLVISVSIKEREADEKKIEKYIELSMVEDERDKLINLKSSNVGYACSGIGFFVALIVIAATGTVITALHIIFGSFLLGSLVEGCVGIFFHERGVKNG